MQERTNRRGYTEYFVKDKHLKLNNLKLEAERFGLENRYLRTENIPEYPKPEFHTSLLKHETTGSALGGIRKDGGFKNPYGGPLIWWSLAVGPEELKDAEVRLLEKTFPDRMEVEDAEQQSFLWRFATSPAFLETSRLGTYRFTFPLQEVLTAYRDQFCSGSQPIMRVYETVLYKQEVMHVVLVHSPAHQNFSHCPFLTDDPEAVCVYRDGHFIWRSEAMCGKHWLELVSRPDSQQLEACGVAEDQHYVWDHVAVALHVGKTQVLKFDADRLRNNLKYCLQDDVNYTLRDHVAVSFDDAKRVVKNWWPDWSGPLEMESSLQQSLTVTDIKLVLVGWPGVGKSSSVNTILGINASSSGAAVPPSGRTRCCLKRGNIFNREVTIIDTPGFSRTSKPEFKEQLFRCINLSTPEPYAVLLVIRLGFFTTEVEETVKQMPEMFGENVWSRTMILFTHQDQAEPDIQNQLEKNGNQLKILFEKVGNRFQVLNNNLGHRDVQQVWDLLFEVKEMLVNNNRRE